MRMWVRECVLVLARVCMWVREWVRVRVRVSMGAFVCVVVGVCMHVCV